MKIKAVKSGRFEPKASEGNPPYSPFTFADGADIVMAMLQSGQLQRLTVDKITALR